MESVYLFRQNEITNPLSFSSSYTGWWIQAGRSQAVGLRLTGTFPYPLTPVSYPRTSRLTEEYYSHSDGRDAKDQVHLCKHLSLQSCCMFPVATVTNYHKFGDLLKQKFITLQLWSSEVQNGFHQSKWIEGMFSLERTFTRLSCGQGCAPSRGFREWFSCLEVPSVFKATAQHLLVSDFACFRISFFWSFYLPAYCD